MIDRERLLQMAKVAGIRKRARTDLPISRSELQGPPPLSHAQRRLWFLEQLEGTGAAYHMPMGLRLSGQLNRAALRRALDRIVARHEALRTCFVRVGEEPAQNIAPPDCGFALRETDLSRTTHPEETLQRLASEEAASPFDLRKHPLVRGRLIQLGESEHVLLITMHHIVCDGWSIGIFLWELSELYRAYVQGRDDPLPPLDIQYADYALWQHRRLAGDLHHEQSRYWQSVLAHAPVLLDLPIDHVRPAQQSHAGAFIPIELDESLTAGLHELSRRHGATAFMTLLTGWAILLSRLSGQLDLVIGTPVANRVRPELEPLIGLFVNTLALRIDLSGALTVGELLDRVKRQVQRAQQNQDLPFEQVVEIISPPRSLAHTPVFQVTFAWQGAAQGGIDLLGLQVAPFDVSSGAVKFDLALDLSEVDGRIVGSLEYATALFARDTIERQLEYFRHVLEAMAADEHQIADRVTLLDKAGVEFVRCRDSQVASGEVDRKALPPPGAASACIGSAAFIAPRGDLERSIAAIWKDLLRRQDEVGAHDNFFDVGGHSLLLLKLHARLEALAGREIVFLDLFKHTTIASQARYLAAHGTAADQNKPMLPSRAVRLPVAQRDVAVIGMAGKFPVAYDVDAFWEKVSQGVECISDLTAEELKEAGIAAQALSDPNHVKRDVLAVPDIDCFDARFFGVSPREAAATDPQQRLFLESAWHALEDAGYDPFRYKGRVGVFASQGDSEYLFAHILPSVAAGRLPNHFQNSMGSGKDFLATQVAYRLNLTGPAISVQTACSSSLVAVHLACRSLLDLECDIALAGGVSLRLQRTGYWHEPEGILSPDGCCRPFAATANGTVPGSGLGIVALKRLADALRDGDAIHAVIKGSAISNDGRRKAGYTAPSEDGQVQAIEDALSAAGADPSSIGYIEAHGTGTVLGDPIEIAALTRVFARSTVKPGSCALGSLKANMGHLDTASGVAGLIKAVLALKARQLPPSLHVTVPNAHVDWSKSPFYINTTLRPWAAPDHGARRAGVSSFGIGGTNAHVVLEEAPETAAERPSALAQVLTISAKSEAALSDVASRLARYLRAHPAVDLADVAFTLQEGRHPFSYRHAVIAESPAQAAAMLDGDSNERHSLQRQADPEPGVVFMFPGQGTQYVRMGAGLYEHAPRFRECLDRCAAILQPLLGLDIRPLLFPSSLDDRDKTHALAPTGTAQPALFSIEYALAQQWMAWGVQPRAMIGHSLGEYVAAHLAGVFTLEDVLSLVVKRGALMQSVAQGSMLSVALAPEEVSSYLSDDVVLAASNAPTLCVLSGTVRAIDAVEELLRQEGVGCGRIRASHAFHSPMMDCVVAPFVEHVRAVPRQAPKIPFVSNLTGTWISAEQACDPSYWGRHLREPVRFAKGAQELLREKPCMLEVGPGHTLTQLARQNGAADSVHCMRGANEQGPDFSLLMRAAGKLWCAGVELDWAKLHEPRGARRVHLPTYPFARERHWIDPPETGRMQAAAGEQASVSLQSSDAQTHGSSASNVENQITEVWQEILGIDRIGPDDDFFDLGGHSLLGIRMIALLKRRGIVVTSVDIFNHRTIRRLAGCVAARRAGTTSSGAIAVRASGALLPLFLVHEYYGLDMHFAALAEHIDSRIPVYGLPAISLEERQLETLEGLAARLVRIVRSIQPEGPYRLAGWSFSGALAYEVANQLIGEDQTVSFVGLIDSYSPQVLHAYAVARRQRDNTLAKRLLTLCEGELTNTTEHSDIICELRAQTDSAGFEATVAKCRQKCVLPLYLRDLDTQEIHRYLERLVAHSNALEHYVAHPIPATVQLFIAQDKSCQVVPADRWLGWRTVLPESQITVIEVPGNHNTIMDPPHIGALGRAISQALLTATARTSLEQSYRPLVAIQDGRATKQPLVCIPGAGDSATRFLSLAEALEGEHPVYGMQPRGIYESLVPHSTVQAAAAAYLRELQIRAGNAPVHLLGHSFGGWVAFEMALRLAAEGSRVMSLTLVDSGVPASEGTIAREHRPLQVLAVYIELMELQAERSLRLPLEELEPLDHEARLRLLHARLVAGEIMPARTNAETLRGPLRAFAAAIRAAYTPSACFDGPVNLVTVSDTRLSSEANNQAERANIEGWKKWVPGARCWRGPGNHMTILKPPHVNALARWWLQSL